MNFSIVGSTNAARPKLRDKSYRSYESLLRRYVRPALGERILSAITPLDVQSAYQKMIDRGLSARTVRYTHSVLRSAIRQAIRWRLLAQDPTDGAQLPRLRRREMRVLGAEQSRAFLSAALKTHYGPVFAVALTTGMRPAEYLALKWQDIDWVSRNGKRCAHARESQLEGGVLLRRSEPAAAALLSFRIGCSKHLRICRQERSGGADVAGLTIRSWSSPLRLVAPSTPTSWQKGSRQFSARTDCPSSDFTTYATRPRRLLYLLACRPRSLLSSSVMPVLHSPWMSTRTYCRTCRRRPR